MTVLRRTGPLLWRTDVPQADPVRSFRECAGEFATGVCVVTAEYDGQAAGMTINSFTSVSLFPLIVLVSLAEGTRTLRAVRQSGRFALSVLALNQRDVANAFARQGKPFPAHHVVRDGNGGLTVPGAVARIWCRVHDIVPAGDHQLVLGEVRAFCREGGEPLLFHRGRYSAVSLPFGHGVDDEGAAW